MVGGCISPAMRSGVNRARQHLYPTFHVTISPVCPMAMIGALHAFLVTRQSVRAVPRCLRSDVKSAEIK
jgi:hypothetical protein